MPGPEFVSDPSKFLVRTCFIDESKTQLVQVQNGCFFHNWRKIADTSKYQHYEQVRPEFLRDWQTFCSFLESSSLQRPNISRCEVTYFNHLARGEDWTDFSELSGIFPAWNGIRNEELLSRVEAINVTVWYGHADGKVQFNASSAIRQADGKEIIQLTVTASATPTTSSDDELLRCLDACHENAVRGFLKFTSEKIQNKWERVR